MMETTRIGGRGKSGIDVSSRVVEKWQTDGYKKACMLATKKGVQKAMAVVKKTVKPLIPEANPHRIVRSYPSGYKSTLASPDRFPLNASQALKSKVGYVRGSKTQVYGYLRDRPGYSIFVNYGHDAKTRSKVFIRKIAGVHYMEKGLDTAKPTIIPLLRAEWPK